MHHRHNEQLPVSASQPEHELHQRYYLVHVGTAALALAAALTAILTAAAA